MFDYKAVQSNLTVYFACTSTNCKNWNSLSVKKGQKKYVASSGLSICCSRHLIETINGEKNTITITLSKNSILPVLVPTAKIWRFYPWKKAKKICGVKWTFADFWYVILWHLNYRWAKIQLDTFLFHVQTYFYPSSIEGGNKWLGWRNRCSYF